MLNKDQREILQDAINRARTFNLYATWNTADDLHGAAMMIDLAAHVLWWDLSEDEKNDSSNGRPPTTNERTMYEDARHLWYSLIKASDARREKDIERARARAEECHSNNLYRLHVEKEDVAR
jgi:hypothetical protein